MLEELFKQQLNTDNPDASVSCRIIQEGVHIYYFSCTHSIISQDTSDSQPHYEAVFCQNGHLRLELTQGRRVNLSEREILILADQNDIQEIFVANRSRGVLLSVDAPVVLRKAEDLVNIFCGLALNIRKLVEIIQDNYGCAVIRNSLWNDATFDALEDLPQSEKEDYCLLKIVDLIFLISHSELSVSPPLTAEYFGRQQSDIARQIHDDMLAHLELPLTIAQLADRHHISQTMLKDCFRSQYGKPIHTFLREQRMRQAAEMLRTTSMQIIEIAARVGYDSASQFGQAFRRQYHLSPSQYRRTINKNEKNS